MFSAHTVYGSNISFETPSSVHVGQNVDLLINLETDGVLINSIELTVHYDIDLFSFIGYEDKNSLLKLWIAPPHEIEGKIYLSGIIPGGVSGVYDPNRKDDNGKLAPLPLVHLFFTAKKEGRAEFSFIDSKVLEHDGLGTPLPHDEYSAHIVVEKRIDNNYIKKQEETYKKENTDVIDSPESKRLFKISFLVLIFVVISGIIVNNWLKYKHNGK